jgi:hypothetical protein
MAGALVLAGALWLSGCGESAASSRYALDLPEPPAAWAFLGEPGWRLEWLDSDGRKQSKIIEEREGAELDIYPTVVSALIASPRWPVKGIEAGVFRPAGALFPFDAAGGVLRVSWRAGVDAVLFWELAAAAGRNPEALEAKTPRLPQNFNWPRFRELFAAEGIHENVRNDPWLADWRGIAKKIAVSGFDKRRLVPRSLEPVPVPAGRGPWAGSSPFAPPLVFAPEETPRFPAGEEAETWISSGGILRCNRQTWIFTEF